MTARDKPRWPESRIYRAATRRSYTWRARRTARASCVIGQRVHFRRNRRSARNRPRSPGTLLLHRPGDWEVQWPKPVHALCSQAGRVALCPYCAPGAPRRCASRLPSKLGKQGTQRRSAADRRVRPEEPAKRGAQRGHRRVAPALLPEKAGHRADPVGTVMVADDAGRGIGGLRGGSNLSRDTCRRMKPRPLFGCLWAVPWPRGCEQDDEAAFFLDDAGASSRCPSSRRSRLRAVDLGSDQLKDSAREEAATAPRPATDEGGWMRRGCGFAAMRAHRYGICGRGSGAGGCARRPDQCAQCLPRPAGLCASLKTESAALSLTRRRWGRASRREESG